MLRNKFRYFISVLICVLTFTGIYAQQVKLTVLMNGNAGIGDTFAMQVELVNVKGDFSPPASIPGAKVERNMMTGQASTVVMGSGGSSVSSSKTYVMQLKANKAGSFSYGPITVGGVKSNKVSYTIGKVSNGNASGGLPQTGGSFNTPVPQQPVPSNSQSGSSGPGSTFLKASVSNSTPYEQEAVVYTVRLYSTLKPYDWLQASVPKFDNCTYEISDDISRVFTQEVLNGKTYNTAVIARYIIYPTQPGKITVKGNAFTGSVADGDAMRDPFSGQVFFTNSYQVNETPNNIELDVKPLPDASAHDDVNGVGVFDVSISLGSKEFRTNEVAKFLVTVQGTGNLGFVSLPDLRRLLPAELKLLKSEAVITKNSIGSDVKGKVVFECTVIPQKEGEFELPALPFEFFDAKSAEWYKRTTEPLRVSVIKGSQTHTSDNSLKFDSTLQEAGRQKKQLEFYSDNFYYWLWYIVPLLIFIAVLIAHRKRLALLADPELLKHKKANALARKRLKLAYAAMSKGNADLFYDEMLKGMWGYLGDKLGMPISDLTRSNVSTELKEAGVSTATAEAVIGFIDDCEFAKYGSSKGTDMKRNYEDACKLINELESEIKIETASLKD